jgi:rubrerythrin
VPPDAHPPPRPTLADITRAAPADRTLQNLLIVMSGKLDALTQLPVFEYQAASEGFDRCAETFRLLADAERGAFEELTASLRVHLDETAERITAEARRGCVR